MATEVLALRVPAPAKINLFLHVGPRRADGYHVLQSLVCFTEAGDVLSVAPSEHLSLAVEGPFAAGLAGEGDNLILKAARALAAHARITKGAAITLTKNLPVASGIGGGSADAAAALRGLVTLWDVQIPDSDLHAIALTLGSDVPVCVASRPAMMEGRGERVTPVPALPPLPMVLVNPGVAVPTGEVFRRLGRTVEDVLPPLPDYPVTPDAAALLAYLSRTRNDMEPAAKQIAPVIGEVLLDLEQRGVLIARMCGSGATCYGLFESDAAAEAAARGIAAAHASWWAVATRIAGAEIAA